MEFSFLDLLVSMAGGIFGAVIGAFPVWILCGLAVLIGATVNFVNGNGDFMGMVAWGHFLGPQTSFVGGTAAAAYAAKHKLIDSGRDISTSLIGLQNPKVLMIGGLFGAIGYILFWALMQVPNYNEMAWTNVIALVVILAMIIIRFVYGQTGLFGRKVEGDDSCWIPNENAAWVNYQSRPEPLLILGFTVGLAAAYYAQVIPGSSGLIFGFVTFLLIFMLMGFKVPVTHHIALSASMVSTVTGSIEWGVTFGILAAYLGEMCACLFLYRADTHIDPPTFALVLTFTIFPVFWQFNIFALPAFAGYAIMAAIIVGGYFMLAKCKKCYCKCA
ncbi:MAG: hypothetical protein SNH63_07445 [Rikenellaceae bacterium]